MLSAFLLTNSCTPAHCDTQCEIRTPSSPSPRTTSDQRDLATDTTVSRPWPCTATRHSLGRLRFGNQQILSSETKATIFSVRSSKHQSRGETLWNSKHQIQITNGTKTTYIMKSSNDHRETICTLNQDSSQRKHATTAKHGV